MLPPVIFAMLTIPLKILPQPLHSIMTLAPDYDYLFSPSLCWPSSYFNIHTENQFESLASVPWLLQLQPSFPKHHLSQPLLQLYLMISMAVSLTRSCRSTKIHTTSENCISTILLFDHPLPSLPFYICGITTIVWLHRVLQTTEPTIFSPSTTLLISFLHLLRFHNSAWESLPYKDLLTLHHS